MWLWPLRLYTGDGKLSRSEVWAFESASFWAKLRDQQQTTQEGIRHFPLVAVKPQASF